MKFIIIILSLIICIKTISYGLYEIKKNQNNLGGIFVITLGIFSSSLAIIVLNLRGI